MKKANCLLFCSLLVAAGLLASCGGGGGGGGGAPAGTRLLTIISAHGLTSPTAGDHYIAIGEEVTVSCGTTPYPPDATGTRYNCTGWTGGSGDIPLSGSETSYAFTMSQNSTITWRWQTQYQLTTTVTPSDTGTIIRSPDIVWYNSGATVQLTASPATPEYRFASWSGGLSGNPATLTMNGPRTVTATFNVQIRRVIAVTSGHGVPDPPVGETSVPDGDPYTVYCGASPVLDPVHAGTRYLCTGWTGGSGDISATGTNTFYHIALVTHDSSITWTWQTQYRLVTALSPLEGGTLSVVPTTPDGWHNADSALTCTATANPGYRFQSWSGFLRSTVNPLNLPPMHEPKGLVANFESIPIHITVISLYGEPDPPVGISPHPGGATVTVSCGTTPYPPSATGTRFVCTGWTGGSGNIPVTGTDTSCTIPLLTQDSAITWTWKTQYQLTTAVSPLSGGWVSLTPTPETGGWYDANTVVACNAGAYLGYNWVGWSGDASAFTEGFEAGDISGWTTGGDANWSATDLEKHSGTYSARSGTITHSQSTYIEKAFTVGAGGGSVTFWWKVSSEADHDWLEFYIDNVLQAGRISGETGWAQVTFALAGGTRTLRWRYVRDSSGSAGGNCGWIDDISQRPIALTMDAPKSIIANFFRPTLTVLNPSGYDAPNPLAGDHAWAYNTSVTCSVTSPTAAGPGTQYVCTGYTGTGNCLSGTGISVTFTITQDSSITWLWKTQYYLTITVLPTVPVVGGTVTPSSAWYDSGESVSLTANPNPSGGFGFSNWSGDLAGTNNTETVAVDRPKSITANFSILSPCAITVTSEHGEPTPPVGTITYPSGYSVTLSCGPTPYAGAAGTRYVCTGWSGGSGDVPSTGGQNSYTIPSTSSPNSTITWTWKTQYLLTAQVLPSGGGSVTLTPSATDGWYDDTDLDTVVSCNAAEAAGYGFVNWTGDPVVNPDAPATPETVEITMNGPKSITATFFKPTLTISTNPSGCDAPVPAVGTSTVDYGSNVTCSVSSRAFDPETGTTTEGFETGAISGKWTTGGSPQWFITNADRHSGTYSVRSGVIPRDGYGNSYIEGTFALPRDGSLTFWWKIDSWRASLDFYIDGVWRDWIGYDTDWQQQTLSLAAGTHTLKWQYRGGNYGYGHSECGWIDDITITCPGANYVLTGFTGTGSAPASGSENSVTFPITQNSSVTWNWKIVYKVTVNINPRDSGEVVFDPPATDVCYFDANSNVTLTANPIQQDFTFRFWEGDLTGSTNPETLTMNAPKTVTANFRSLPYTVRVASEHGEPDPPVGENTYDGGTTVTVSCGPTPYPTDATGTRYLSRGWTGGSGDIPATGPGTSRSFIVTQDSTITWVWQTQYQLTTSVQPVGGGTVTPGSGSWYNAGTVVVCNAIANLGYGWVGWTGDWSGTERPRNLSMTGPKSITANFIRPTITVSNIDDTGAPVGYGSPSPQVGTTPYNYGQSVTCSVTSPFYVPTPTNLLNQNFNAGTFPSDWTTGGDVDWTVASGEGQTHEGTYSVRSGAIGNSGTTYIQKVLNITQSGGGTMTFWWKVSSELNYDFLKFDIDGVEQAAISGETGWVQSQRFFLAQGRRTLRWTYTKDYSVSSGSDCGWIDSVLIITTPGTQYVCTGYTGTGNCPAGGSESSVSFPITQDSSITWHWKTKYRLVVNVNPSGSGSVNILPFTDNYYDAGTYLTLTAVANMGYVFGLWSGGMTGFSDSQGLTMDAPKTGTMSVTANLTGPNRPSNFTGTANNESSITWTWSGASDWQAAAAGALRSVAATLIEFQTLYGDLPASETCPRAGSGNGRLLFEATDDLPGTPGTQNCPTVDASAAYTYTITYTRAIGIKGFESGDISGWTSGGDATWFATDLEKHSGVYSAHSGAIGDSQSSYIERAFNVPAGGCTVTFWWKVSSELDRDYLKFYIDGSEQAAISGEIGWESRTFSLSAGTRTLRWQYEKNGSVSSGSDCGWIDDISGWTCTADTHLSSSYDYYTDQTRVLRQAVSTGDGAQANASSPESPNNVWFEVQDNYQAMITMVYPNITSWQETGLDENTQYTRHVHAMNYGTYSDPSNDASCYTLVHNATTADFTLTVLSGASRSTIGTGSISERYPIDISANYARCQMLYRADEMGSQSRTIVKIAFQRYAGDPLSQSRQVNNATIWMGLTTVTSLANSPGSAPRWIDTSTHAKVYDSQISGDLTVPFGAANTWFEIPLTETFFYDGTRSLVVTFSHEDGSKEDYFTTWKNHQVWYYWGGESAYVKCLAGAGDSPNPSVSPVEDRPNIQFEFAGRVTITIVPPPNSTADDTGVRIERDKNSGFPSFPGPVRVQDFRAVYTKDDAVPSGDWYYRIRFCNGDGTPSAYSSGVLVTVPGP